jgi:hypothetical protein
MHFDEQSDADGVNLTVISIMRRRAQFGAWRWPFASGPKKMRTFVRLFALPLKTRIG